MEKRARDRDGTFSKGKCTVFYNTTNKEIKQYFSYIC